MPPEKLQAYLSANAGKMTERGLRLRQTKVGS
jgi:hypothetical protein